MRFRRLATTITAAALTDGVLATGKRAVERSNNLSYLGALTAMASCTLPIGHFSLGAVFPTGMSCGSNIPETIGMTTHSNTSRVDHAGAPLAPAECVATEWLGFPEDRIEPIYWQKSAANAWQAGYCLGVGIAHADYIDSGDDLERVSRKMTSLTRVETNTFATLVAPTVRFYRWYLLGQRTDELGDAHATTDAAPRVRAAWPHAVNNTPSARLNTAGYRQLRGHSSLSVEIWSGSRAPCASPKASDRAPGERTARCVSKAAAAAPA